MQRYEQTTHNTAILHTSRYMHIHYRTTDMYCTRTNMSIWVFRILADVGYCNVLRKQRCQSLLTAVEAADESTLKNVQYDIHY